MKYLVTGGCGFIGSNLIKSLTMNDNTFVYCVDNESGGEQKLDHPKAVSYTHLTLPTNA